ncbi:hypothetical protein LS482_12145 [Sinomicrobium kalidii]|uniref:hypothetical protein n=1 Tax=Sinomicrobium kalidii TaxID=2900738 RepID=UPI001E616F7A|nr:hypothetical protein [Sinomicrobium kalidii]UGU14452.1 hypothetical protein LS482_12145 [Sinomicrobium kalidii]
MFNYSYGMKSHRSYEHIIIRGTYFLILLIAINTLFMVCYKYQDQITIKKIDESKNKETIKIIVRDSDIKLIGKPKLLKVCYQGKVEKLTVLKIIDSIFICEKPPYEFYQKGKSGYYINQEKNLLQLITDNIN